MATDTELKTLIEKIVREMAGEGTASEEHAPQMQSESSTTQTSRDEFLPDISEILIKKELLVPEPADEVGYLDMKDKTPARLGVWRSGARYMTSSSLRFKADHAAAQDAVFSYVSEDFVKDNNLFPIATVCQDKDEYVTRPDLGRQFTDEVKEKIKTHCGDPKVQIVVGDGLSSASIEANLENTLPAIKQGLKLHGIEATNDLFIKHCRVPAMDVVGELTGADVVCLLVGERPGLVTAESMSAYIAYKPTVDMPEARRTVISNIHEGGTPPVEAGAHIAELIKKMIDKKASGLDLNKV
ncbi:ethanolamine ammonia-lyase subunit EutC [Oceanobacillus jeddahense]|uniref:ethanolamine ammonia-lyase subunit EutC n=1 Tax=Oceanobacillus jeddahense TaxID=1462527 RepID=UPI003638599D